MAVEGDADLAGPSDVLAGLEPTDVPRVLREVYSAAVGRTRDEWAGLDGDAAAERHTAVLIRPVRLYSNPAGSA